MMLVAKREKAGVLKFQTLIVLPFCFFTHRLRAAAIRVARQPPGGGDCGTAPIRARSHRTVNRLMWGFNVGLMTDVIKPTSRVYRFVVVKPIRTGHRKFGKNLTFRTIDQQCAAGQVAGRPR